MNEKLFLFAAIGNTRVAIRASEIEAVVRLSGVTPIPLAPRHVRGLATLRSRVLTVIDMDALVFGVMSVPKSASLAFVSDIGGHSYGFLVDAVSDICDAADGIQPVRGRLDPAWAPFTQGFVEQDGKLHLLISPAAFTAPVTPAIVAA